MIRNIGTARDTGPAPTMEWTPRHALRGCIGVALVAALTVIPGCKKKDDKAALEAVETGGKKPPVVHRKAKDAGAEAADKLGDKPGADKLAAGAGATRPPIAKPVVSPGAAPTPGPAGSPVVALQPGAAVPAAPVVNPGDVPAAAPGAAAAPEAKAATAEAAAEKAEAVADKGAGDKASERPGGVIRGDRKGPEVPVAAPEAPPAPVPVAHDAGEPPLDVSGYISAMDLELVLGTKQKFRRADLPGVPATSAYNALYYQPEKGDQFGVSVQVWRDGNLAESRTRFNTMRNTYSNVAPTNKVTEQGFRSFYSGVVTVVFADPRRPIVAAVACATKLCNADQLLHLARNVSERLR
jgi:hypothetical protein